MGRKPISPATFAAPRSKFPPTMMPAPIPVPRAMNATSSRPMPAPPHCSPRTARFTSFSSATSIPSASDKSPWTSMLAKSAILGAISTRPVFFSGTPGTPTTADFMFSNGILLSSAARRQRRLICSITRLPPRGSVGSITSPSTRQERSAMAARIFVPPRSTVAMQAASGTIS